MTTSTSTQDDTTEEFYPRRWAAMIVLVLGFTLDLLNVTIVNVGLPAIQADLGELLRRSAGSPRPIFSPSRPP